MQSEIEETNLLRSSIARFSAENDKIKAENNKIKAENDKIRVENTELRPDQFDSSFYITLPPLFFKFNMKYYTSYKPIELLYFGHVIILNFFVFYSHFLANKIAVLCIFFLSPPPLNFISYVM